MKLKIIILNFIFIILFLTNFSFANEEIREKYPFFRQFRSGFNLTFGGMSLLKSTQVLNDDESSGKEKDYARILSVIGLMRIGDGLYYLFNPVLPEIYLEKGFLDPTHLDYKKYLTEAASFERKLRKYRASVIFLNGVGFFGLYTEDPKKNSLAIIPGLGMLAVSAYAYFGKAPSEKELAKSESGPMVSFDMYKMNNSYVAYPVLTMKF